MNKISFVLHSICKHNYIYLHICHISKILILTRKCCNYTLIVLIVLFGKAVQPLRNYSGKKTFDTILLMKKKKKERKVLQIGKCIC